MAFFRDGQAWLLPGILAMFAGIGLVLLYGEIRKALRAKRKPPVKFHDGKDRFARPAKRVTRAA